MEASILRPYGRTGKGGSPPDAAGRSIGISELKTRPRCPHERCSGQLQLREGSLVRLIVCDDCGRTTEQLGSNPYLAQYRAA